MNIWFLLILVTMFYAGYNILVKVSVDHALGTATTTILATISLQLAALSASLIFAIFYIYEVAMYSRYQRRHSGGQF